MTLLEGVSRPRLNRPPSVAPAKTSLQRAFSRFTLGCGMAPLPALDPDLGDFEAHYRKVAPRDCPTPSWRILMRGVSLRACP